MMQALTQVGLHQVMKQVKNPLQHKACGGTNYLQNLVQSSVLITPTKDVIWILYWLLILYAYIEKMGRLIRILMEQLKQLLQK